GLRDQPVNQLNKMWKNSDFVPIGRIKISELIDKDDIALEKMSFNPFENIEGLQPVGKIQQLRDKAYKASFKTRNA
ncbi:MAG: catalase, partial [Chryseobacterium sp.]|nr:catalase [Chryseobacterium sp.]